MTQNIYDDPDFFTAYSQFRRSVEGLAGAPEWPSLRRLLPDLHGLRVVDLGCGYGWFCRWARENGAGEVLGIDVSERMLARARAMTSDDRITYARADFMAPRRPGWIVDSEGRRSWQVDGYLVEGPRTTHWLVEGVVKQHRTLGTTLNNFSDARASAPATLSYDGALPFAPSLAPIALPPIPSSLREVGDPV